MVGAGPTRCLSARRHGSPRPCSCDTRSVRRRNTARLRSAAFLGHEGDGRSRTRPPIRQRGRRMPTDQYIFLAAVSGLATVTNHSVRLADGQRKSGADAAHLPATLNTPAFFARHREIDRQESPSRRARNRRLPKCRAAMQFVGHVVERLPPPRHWNAKNKKESGPRGRVLDTAAAA